MNNIFSTCTILAARQPMHVNPECLTGECEFEDTFRKIHRFFHERLKVPVVWLIAENMLDMYGEMFREWRRDYGDEFGIYETGLAGVEANVGYAQEWPEKMGLKRPSVPHWPYGLPWADIPESVQIEAIRFLKSRMDEVLDQDTKLMYAANGDAGTVRAMKKAGIQIMWGYNWNLYGDFVDATGKGVLFYPFYVSDVHAKAPAPVGDRSVLGVQWGAGDPLNVYAAQRVAKVSGNNVCLNAHELANRSGELDRGDFIEKFVAEMAEQARWNPFAYIPIQIEAYWMDEGGSVYGQHPHFPSRTTEVFFRVVETAIAHGAKIVTHAQFLDWYQGRFDRTPEMVWYCEDLLAGQRFRGKDQDYPPMVLYGDNKRQIIFLKSQGFNPVRSYSYDPVQEVEDPRLEYPFTMEPCVELKVKEWTTPRIGVTVTPDDVHYGVEDFDLTSYDNEPEYAFVLWEANIPDYVEIEDLECSPNISRIRLLREKNVALVFASLRKGDNEVRIRSEKPGRFIRIEEQQMSGRRYEIYIRNDGPMVRLSRLHTNIGPNLRIGGFWWNGKYHLSIYHYHYSPYDWRTGAITINTGYPLSLALSHGTTRCSIEILGKM